MSDITVQYDPHVDALYLSFRPAAPGEATRDHELDERRRVDYNDAGEALGVEILYPAADGIDLEGVPRAEEIRSLLEALFSLRLASAA